MNTKSDLTQVVVFLLSDKRGAQKYMDNKPYKIRVGEVLTGDTQTVNLKNIYRNSNVDQCVLYGLRLFLHIF